jgi:hexosaminidase
MPWPAMVRRCSGRFVVTSSFAVFRRGAPDTRVTTALDRLLRRWEERSGLVFQRDARGMRSAARRITGNLFVNCLRLGPRVPQLGEDESYLLNIGPSGARLQAANGTGILRGLATLEQWLTGDARGWHLSAVQIRDQPRFPWRGLLIDVCRHWQPPEVIKRQLEAMAMVKLNVLHLHLTEDQGFRVESKTCPGLHEGGSDGLYYTQEQLRDIVAYAAERGIRVVPEFDVPGHVTSWLVGHPKLGSAPGPYQIRRNWGVADPALDPTNEKVYTLLERFLREMGALFPDAYLHIGGDEVKSGQWKTNPHIQHFMRRHGLKDNRGLQAYFNRRLGAIVARLGKRMIGWDEILHRDLPASAVVQSWRGVAGLAASTRLGFASLLSNGYYIDLWWPAARHYAVDPLPADSPLTTAQQKFVLGGEATMWTEWTTSEKIDACIWPRAAAIAERLWSPREVRDPDDMYRRLALISRRLEEGGLLHERNRTAMLRRLAGDGTGPEGEAALQEIAAVFEPVKNYARNLIRPDVTQFTPLTAFADALHVESETARLFGADVEQYLFGPGASAAARRVRRRLDGWQQVGTVSRRVLRKQMPRWKEIDPAVARLLRAVRVGTDAFERYSGGRPATRAWRIRALAELSAVTSPCGEVELALGRPLRLLAAAASLPRAERGGGGKVWREQVIAAADVAPPPAAPVYGDHLDEAPGVSDQV